MQDTKTPELTAAEPVLLKESGLSIGAPGDIQDQCLETTRALQICLGETHQHYMTLPRAQSASRLRYRLLRANGEDRALESWQEAQRPDATAPVFCLSLVGRQAGRFLLEIRYSLDGQAWLIDRRKPIAVHIFPPQIQGLRLYTWLPNTLGPLNSWKQKLSSIKDLGFTMIHLLPLTRQGASQSPYAARQLFTLDPTLGEAPGLLTQDWFDFVEACQSLKLSLCIDLVVNHVASDSDLAKKRPEWIHLDEKEADGLRRAGFHGPEGWHSWRDLLLLNYRHPDRHVRQELWDYILRYALYWAGFAAKTGGMVRLDNLHSTPLAFAETLTKALRSEYPSLAILGEYFGTSEACQDLLQSCEIDLLLATPWEHHFAHDLRQYLSYLHKTQALVSWFCPINSHDSGPPAQEFASVDATLPRYVLSAGLGTGASGMSQGVERGLLEKINFIGPPPPQRFAPERDFRPVIQRINQLLAQHRAFQQGSQVRFVDQGHDAVIAALRFHPADPDQELFLLIANLDIYSAHTLRLSSHEWPEDKRTFWDYLQNKRLPIQAGDFSLELPPCAIHILQLQNSAYSMPSHLGEQEVHRGN